MSQDAFIYDAVRTPRGLGKPTGALYEIKPIDLVAGLMKAVQERNPQWDAQEVDDVVLGIVTPVGDQGGCLPRLAALTAGLPESVPGVQLNRFCGSGLEAVNQAAGRVQGGWESMFLAGGVESMSRVRLLSDGGAWTSDPATAGYIHFIPQGVSADLVASREGFTREMVDEYAAQSHVRAAQAWEEGRFARSVVPVKDMNGMTVLERDESIRPGTTQEILSGLRPSFATLGREAGFDAVALDAYPEVEAIDHVHHAGNSSGIVDGASLMLIGSAEAGARADIRPRARIAAAAVVGSEPTIMLNGPTPACEMALERAGMTAKDIDLVEVNEAFAAVPLKLMKDMGWSPDQVNVNGGAIAMGHPLGATGAIILGTLLDELERRDLQTGIATLCIGAGMGIATVIERV